MTEAIFHNNLQLRMTQAYPATCCAHDMAQLRDQVRSTLQLQLQTHIDGTVSVQLDGRQHRYRLAAALRSNDILINLAFLRSKIDCAFVIGMAENKK